MVKNQTNLVNALNFVKSELKKELHEEVYQTWFESMTVADEEDSDEEHHDHITLRVPNDFAVIWINDNYKGLLTRKLQMVLGKSLNITLQSEISDEDVFSVEGSHLPTPCPAVSSDEDRKRDKESDENYALNPKNTFANFIVGPKNQMAQAASIAIAHNPGKAYNPLFLYGYTGLGKTHLMHAVAHQILEHNRKAKVLYTSTEKFTNEFIFAIQHNRMTQFRQKYRKLDIFLLDDVHFLSGKERIQEEFFFTFNELFEAQKQIFLASDRPAAEISKLEHRLISRFQWGLVVDIQPPDLETRIAILAKKAEDIGLSLDHSVLSYLAERISTNVRRLEGALMRITEYVRLTKSKIDSDVLKILMRDIFHDETTAGATIDVIQQKVAEFYDLKTTDILGKRRSANIAMPRQIAMYLCRTLTTQSLVEIGLAFGGRDHSTVIHACKAIENMMAQDAVIKRNVEHLKKILQKI
ncbi:MAG: chromosomal replication initiator protein DnaA [Puniceicoccales bacterium]|jgi:chromosomal replication initiator protein|nr:chromosomal replication initiator protein DnaA [Puniceicoccales bacterium]